MAERASARAERDCDGVVRSYAGMWRRRSRADDGCPVACVGDVPFGYVNVFKAHVNVGFFVGAELHDSTGLLEGTGRRMRHVKLKPGVELNVAALSALIHAAYADMKSRLMVD